MKFATKPVQHYPPDLKHVTTLPWDITNKIFCLKFQFFCKYSANMEKCKEIAFSVH